jgi:4-oxalocrotonate tautomerase
MPRIIIQAFSGRTIEQKRELVRRITDAVVEVFEVDPEIVTIRIEEGEQENFAKGGVLAIDRGRVGAAAD